MGRKKGGGGKLGKGQEVGRSKEGARPDSGVHGARGMVEMVPGGGLGGEKRGVGGAVLPVCETVPQKGMVLRRIIRGGRGDLCPETGVYWRYNEEERARVIRSRRGGHVNRLCINVVELLGMVVTAFVMIVTKRDRPERVGEPVLMKRKSSPAAQWVENCKGGEGAMRSGGILGSWGVAADRGKFFPGKTRAGGGERVSRRDTVVEGRRNRMEADQRMLAIPWQA